ncbi:MAG: hypothetical protein PWP34_1806 [Desulfuromonadales bacterium]|jgi:hypothetical protein|nr:hypothetical protein [Desulfuromonadales bacterium]
MLIAKTKNPDKPSFHYRIHEGREGLVSIDLIQGKTDGTNGCDYRR